MIFNLLMMVFLFPTLLGWGEFLMRVMKYQVYFSLTEKLISGVLVLTMLFGVMAFFMPLNVYIEFFFVAVGWLLFFIYGTYNEYFSLFRKHWELWIAFPVLAFVGAFYPFILDHFGYYVPSINWLSQVGLVKGIANLDLVLGQMSFWHIFQAGFSHFSDVFFRINVLILSIYIIYIVEKHSYLHWLFIPILCLFIQSPSPDLPVMVFSLILLDEVLRKNQKFSWLFGVSILIFAIKPTMIWVPIFVFLYLLINQKYIKSWWVGMLVGSLFIAKNLWCFGYPLFPATFLNVGIPWIPNTELMKISSEIAILKTYDMQFSIEEINRFSTTDFIINWFALSGIKVIIHWLFVISLLVFTIFVFIKRQQILWVLWLSVLIKSIFVVWFSAQYRFFIDVFFVVIFVMCQKVIREYWAKKIVSISMLMVIFGLSFPQLIQKIVPSFRIAYFMQGFSVKQLWKPSYYEYKKVKKYKVGNLEFNVPVNYPFTFDSELPSLSIEDIEEYYKIGIFPQLYDKTINSGFRWYTLTDAERRELANVIKNHRQFVEKE